MQLKGSRSTEKGFWSEEMTELPIVANICAVALAKTSPSPAKRDRGASPQVLPPSSLSQKPKMAFPVLDTNWWFKKCWISCCRLKKTNQTKTCCPGRHFPRADFPPLPPSTQELPAIRCSPSKAAIAIFQLRSEIRFVPLARGIWACVTFLGCWKCKGVSCGGCFSVWSLAIMCGHKGVSKSSP